MQFVVLSSLLFMLGIAHAEIAMSPTDTAISTINKAAQLASTMTTTDTRARRSVNLRQLSNEEFNQCQTIANRVVCETGLQEDLYTLALECQQQDTATAAQFICGINNENGLYCGQGLEISQQFEEETSSNCRSFSSCSSSCQNSITRIRDQLGCCSSHWTNLFAGSRKNLDGALWSVCGVSTGELCPIPTYNSTVTSRFCTLAETNRILFSRRCMQSTSGITVETLANTTGCGGVAKIHVETCSVNSNGDFCSLKTDQRTVTNMIEICAQNVVSGTGCSFACRSSMIALRNEFGCCINSLFNGTTIRVVQIPGANQVLRFFTNSFWSRCNVSPPGMCESPLLLPEIRDNGGVKTSGVISIVLIVALAALFL
ncbi:uncharacterized protein LOC135333652 [Halichondria panicea]|uniref:uncharacterized protein LOC135333652 n=1 Tax=Halichondria panicea TaxID=6063 RepID=UPI00312BC014